MKIDKIHLTLNDPKIVTIQISTDLELRGFICRVD